MRYRHTILLTAFFLAIRVVVASALPIFNDEGLYLDYSITIKSDFWEHRYISLNEKLGDWKPPLLYWLGAGAVNKKYPLATGRALSIAVSLAGLFFLRGFMKKLFGEREAQFAAWLYVLAPPLVLYNIQFIAETYVITAALFLLFAITNVFGAQTRRARFLWLGGVILAAAMLPLFKQSGFLYLLLVPAFLIAFLDFKRGIRLSILEKKNLFLSVLCAIVLGYGLYLLLVPGAFSSEQAEFTGKWTFSFSEVASGPWRIWAENLENVKAAWFIYYTFGVFLLFLFFLYRTFRYRDSRDVALFFLWAGASGAVLFGLEGFSEYIYHTAALPFIFMALARVGASLRFDRGVRENLLNLFLMGIFAVVFLHWAYQILLLSFSPQTYFSRSTAWARENYLTGWSNGFQIKPVLEFLKGQEGEGVVFVDPQWGNPGTALKVFQASYPNMHIAPLPSDFYSRAAREDSREFLRSFSSRFIVFSDWRGTKLRNYLFDPIFNGKMCDDMWKIQTYSEQTPLVVCSFDSDFAPRLQIAS